MPLGQQGSSPPTCHRYSTVTVSSPAGSTVMYGLGFGVGVPSGALWSKNSNCWGVDSLAMVGMICTQYSRQFLVCPRAISTQLDPATSTGTEAMACRTVSAVGPSASLHVAACDVCDACGVAGFAPQAAANNANRITM